MRRWGLFAGASLVAIAGTALLLTLVFDGDPERRAIWLAAAVAWGVQLLGFAIVRMVPRERVMGAWAGAATLRFVALGVFAFLVVRPLALPATPALLSLATFLFLSTLLETRFLK